VDNRTSDSVVDSGGTEMSVVPRQNNLIRHI